MMKKIILISAFVFSLGLASHVFAANTGFTALAPIPGLTQGVTADSAGLANFFNNLYKYLIGIAAILAIIQIIYAGIRIATNQDSVSTVTEMKGRIVQAIYGLILVLSPVLVFSIINPNILNLSLNLPPLTYVAPQVNPSSGSVAQTAPAAPISGCMVTNSGTYLEMVVCASKSDATNYVCKNAPGTKISFCKSTSFSLSGCADSNANLYCTKKQKVTRYYQTTLGVGNYNSSTVVPRDATAEQAFTSGCAADSGKVQSSYQTMSNFTCSTDTRAPTSGVGCVDAELSCIPNQQIQQANVGCATTHSGPYLETAVCSTQGSALDYKCQNGLQLTVSVCKSMNPNTKVCEDTNINVSCGGKKLETVHYYNTYVYGLISGVSTPVVPRDDKAERDFTSGCVADGGKVMQVFPSLIPCPADAGIPNFNTANQSGIKCQQAIMTCKP